jgi:hypothetical protein
MNSGFGFETPVAGEGRQAEVPYLRCARLVPRRTYEEREKMVIKDRIGAFWYVMKFNLFYSMKKSFRSLPAACFWGSCL